MFPWNSHLLLQASAHNYNRAASSLDLRQNSGFVDLLVPLPNKPDSTKSNDPLLIIQSTGAPTPEVKR